MPSSSFMSSLLSFHLIVIVSSHPRRCLIPAVVVPHRIVRRFRLLVAICSRFPHVSLIRRRRIALVRRLVPFFVSSVVPFLVSSSSRLVVSSLVRRLVLLPVSLDTEGRGVFPYIDSEAGKQRAGGHTIETGKQSEAGRGGAAGSKGRGRPEASRYEDAPLIYKTGRGVGAYRFSWIGGGGVFVPPSPYLLFRYRAS